MVSRDQAMYLAYEQELDLVEVGPKASPPIAKIMDLGKYRYEQEKQLQKQKSKAKGGELKEIRLSFNIDEHDFEVKVKKAQEFLGDHDKVRLSLKMAGRQNLFKDQALKNMHRFKEVSGGEFETQPVLQGNRFYAMLINRNKNG